METDENTTSVPRDLLAGSPYKSLAEIGRGGMGVVLEAEHRKLGKIVCVKLLLEDFTERPDLADRFRLEAQALARLQHPNLVAVTDFGALPGTGQPYLVMERLRGRTLLEERKARGFLPVAEAVEIACQALTGLAAAHDQGLIHRDIKPANIFLCDPVEPGARRVVKLLDFGLVKLAVPPASGSTKLNKAVAPLAYPTSEGIALGTPKFSSPEALLGSRLDLRADLYSLALVLYTLVAGRGPFDHRKGILDLSRAHVGETPEPPSAYAKQPIPKRLDEAILRALSKDPETRFPDARAFAEELRRGAVEQAPARWMKTEPVVTPTPSPVAVQPVVPAAGSPPASPPVEARKSEQHPRARRGPISLPTEPLPPGFEVPVRPTAAKPGPQLVPVPEAAAEIPAPASVAAPEAGAFGRYLPFVAVSVVGTLLLTALGLAFVLGYFR